MKTLIFPQFYTKNDDELSIILPRQARYKHRKPSKKWPGFTQNPAYYEYTYDTAWHKDAQPLEDWFKWY